MFNAWAEPDLTEFWNNNLGFVCFDKCIVEKIRKYIMQQILFEEIIIFLHNNEFVLCRKCWIQDAEDPRSSPNQVLDKKCTLQTALVPQRKKTCCQKIEKRGHPWDGGTKQIKWMIKTFSEKKHCRNFEEILQQKIAKRVGHQRVKNGIFILLLKIGCIHKSIKKIWSRNLVIN